MRRWIVAGWGLAGAGALGCYSGVDPASDPGQGVPTAADDDGGDDDGTDDGGPQACASEQGASVVRRLTTVEYVNTVHDMFGVDITSDAEALLPADLRSEGFSNQVSGLLVTYDHIEAYHDLAELIVAQLPDPLAVLNAHAACTEFTAECERGFIGSLGRLVWRRPLLEPEVESLRRNFTAALEEGDGFGTGAALVLHALLQAPQFLYRLEDELPADGQPGDLRELSDYEVASRLSYLLWSSSPDDALFEAAAAGQLHTTEQLQAQVERMLAQPRAKETALRYVGDWLALDGLPTINRDPEQYPEFSVALANDMREETLRVAEELLWEERAPITALLTADFTWATPQLAALYGIENPGEGWQRYSLAEVPHRLGVLTHAGVQAINGHGNRPSIVERGLFVLRGVLCSSVAAPPAEVDTSMGELEPGQSPRYYSEQRLANATCNACHGQFDPMGWAFEPYDGIGRWQSHDELGNPLQQDGWLTDPATGQGIPFETTEEFAHVIAENEQADWCVGVRKPLQFAMGRPLGLDDACMSEQIATAAAEAGGSYHALVTAIVTHDSFRHVRAE
ncbi:MAG: DUF1592 domain-containing protein [Myxococcota bacterium]